MNPYVGPRPFLVDEMDLLFGREQEARDLAALASFEPIVLFYGLSGVGKSSLINTRLVPALQEEGFEVLPIVRLGLPLPANVTENIENIFVYKLLLGLSPYLELSPERLATLSLSEYFQESNSQTEPDRTMGGERSRLRMLIIDQFEEIFTTQLDRWQDRKGFFSQLDQALRDDPELSVILALRQDYLGSVDQYRAMLPDKLRARYQLLPLSRQAALEAVAKPAAYAGRPYAPGVAERLVEELTRISVVDPSGSLVEAIGEYVEPMQLQVVCRALWEQMPEEGVDVIASDDIEAFGDIGQVFAGSYEAALHMAVAMTTFPESDMRNWFETELITPARTRGMLLRGENHTGGLPNDVVDVFVDSYLLTGRFLGGEYWLELVHDRFIEPILEANDAWRSSTSGLFTDKHRGRLRVYLVLSFVSGLLLGILGTLLITSLF